MNHPPFLANMFSGRAVLLAELLLIVGMLSILAFRDTRREIQLIFEARLLRRYIKRFSLRSLLLAMAICTITFACLRVSMFSVIVALIMLTGFFGFIYLMSVAIRDISEPTVRRKYSKSLKPFDFDDEQKT